ncbi:hypothetical protein P4159_05715 [Bacillus thuringiensis]|uniref:hypothetical protein n=1 Tax=Bacillus cereus group TaxID=86661 RepID=UPI000CD91951|nr:MULTISPECIES: hypothetical protein [Bacillus cereus group]MEC3596911.1 hypothetical protein [Bacillus thuringiensis]MED1574260.1 hypothetical protein [Bacillus paranthracis]MED1836184.1 hypothetical protein [Bacillus thuringiensis]MED2670247.1 hypothetical protein [Bacillus thuringiensis]MED2694220.1 hypothetical protein [Bacillus thuringiensis]
MKTQLNIMEVLALPEGTKVKFTRSEASQFVGELAIVQATSTGKALFHLTRSGREHKLAMTSATINATFEEHIVIEFVQTDFTALKETSPYKVYTPSALTRGEYREIYKFKDLSDLGIHDIDDLQRSNKFFHKKVNDSLELK